MQYTEIALEVEDRVATITLDRPPEMNAFTNTMMRELLDAFDRTDADDEVRAVVVTGRGRAFCAGADLGGGGETFAKGGSDVSEGAVVRDGGGMVALRIYDSLKPVIAAINGAAVGVGITMTLPMDIRLVSDNAKIGFVFARRGIVPEAASSWFLPRLVGIQQAAEWVYTGRLLTAREAVEGRLALRSHTAEDLLPAAYAIAEEIAHHAAPVSVALSRRMLWRMLGEDHPMAAHRVDSRAIAARGASDDAREGVESFLAKRDAEFPGKVSDGLPDVFPDWSPPSFS